MSFLIKSSRRHPKSKTFYFRAKNLLEYLPIVNLYLPSKSAVLELHIALVQQRFKLLLITTINVMP